MRPRRTNGSASIHENATPAETSSRRRTIASYTDYRNAERAVDWLSDQGFAVERGAIIGTGLRSVEQVTGRMTVGRAALVGAAEGMSVAALIALLFGRFFSGPDFGELLLYSLAVGASFGAMGGGIVPGDRRQGAQLRVDDDRGDGPLRGPGRRGRHSRGDADPRPHARARSPRVSDDISSSGPAGSSDEFDEEVPESDEAACAGDKVCAGAGRSAG
jgi:hypothetical protein